ncbi:MAG TPA: prolipoprotein diacylglyceryl transferase family protein [Kofleriaceae bacterium]|nr:prolipoprotein diacylglyceryl transferase family protein [Kofleriaceae bacterium]
MRPHVLHWLSHHLRADVAGVVAPSWFTCVGLAGLAALVLMLALARRRGIDPGTVASAVLWCYVAAVIAGIAVPALIDGVEHLLATGRFQLRWSGMTSFWGYLAGAAAVVAVCRRDRVSVARIADLAVLPLGVALALARIGCFMAGCDYGKVSSLPWAVRFPAGSPAWRDHVRAGLIPADRAASLPVHPTELYEALLGLVIVGIAIAWVRRRRKDGELFVFAAATYAIGRLAIETLRGDAGRGIYAGLSSGQIFSLLVLLAIAARALAATRRALPIAAAAALALSVAHGDAVAQPAPAPQTADPDEPPATPRPAEPPPAPVIVDEPAPPPAPAGRPLFSVGALVGVATPLNRRSNQVPTLGGTSLSVGVQPGRFGLWLDFDALSSSVASHDTLLASIGFTLRPTPRLMLGARSGIGLTLVNFKDPAFRDVGAGTVRLEAIAEYAFLRHWALWVRPLAIDMISASELGGPITTYQIRIGVAYRFGSTGATRPPGPPPAAPPPPPPEPPPLPPEPPPVPEIGAAP